jgi:hypothetical protein
MISSNALSSHLPFLLVSHDFSYKKDPLRSLEKMGAAYRKDTFSMNTPLSSRHLEGKYAGIALEYGTLSLLMESLFQQSVLVMPLERSIPYGSVTIFQWMVHITTRTSPTSPIAYATMRAAEIKQTAIGRTLIYPPQQPHGAALPQRALVLQQELQACVITLLEQSPQVSQIVVPARYRLPDEWVWSARCEDARIHHHDGSWTLNERVQDAKDPLPAAQ